MIKSRIHTRLMGCDFELIVVTEREPDAVPLLEEGVAEIQRIERLLTTFDEASQTSLLNRHAGGNPVTVAAELHQLIQRCLHLSALTQGAFDITAGALTALYRFKERIPQLPSRERLAETMTRVGHRHIHLFDGDRITLARKGMRISFDGIGKGYAADRVRSLWKARGVESGVINASGDLTAWGQQPDGEPWKIGIADPRHPSVPLFWLPVANASVATSGNYEQYFDIGGVRHSHNIDPRTGMPVTRIKSVTIVSPSAELSDALATAVTVMGKASGLHLVDQLPDTYAIVID
ncbi:MAG TPA: FAD:protein FMN transferase, partial [Puia sp.]|nr:FAD:protein FMN transferase [Puia sp.]